jgi:capsular exopolysaccharide synthesis family protein
MDLQQYLQAVRKFWWVILIPALLGGAYGAYQTSQAVPKYRASITFFIATTSDTGVAGAAQGDTFAQRRVNSYVGLLSSDKLAEMVAETADVGLTPAQVRGMIGGRGDLDTVLLTATVTSTSRALAQDVADAVATEFVTFVDSVESSGPNPASVHLRVVSGPSVHEVATRGKLTTAVKAMVGLLLGLGLAVLLELRDNTVRTEEQLRVLEAGPVLGRIPFDRRVRSAPLLVEADQLSTVAEAFRQLRTNLQFIDIARPVQVLVVTSSVADEGKSVTASNLALSLMAANRHVLLIEADLRRPRLADYFEVDRSIGLTDVIAGQAELDDALHHWVPGGLSVLPSGHLPPNPSELLGSAAMRGLIERLRDRFDMIIIDTPPLLPVTDGAVAAAWADGVVLVVREGKTTRHQVATSVRSLHAVSARLLGVVLTMATTRRGSGYESYERPGDRSPLRERARDVLATVLANAGSPSSPAPQPAAEPEPADDPEPALEVDPHVSARPVDWEEWHEAEAPTEPVPELDAPAPAPEPSESADPPAAWLQDTHEPLAAWEHEPDEPPAPWDRDVDGPAAARTPEASEPERSSEVGKPVVPSARHESEAMRLSDEPLPGLGTVPIDQASEATPAGTGQSRGGRRRERWSERVDLDPRRSSD